MANLELFRKNKPIDDPLLSSLTEQQRIILICLDNAHEIGLTDPELFGEVCRVYRDLGKRHPSDVSVRYRRIELYKRGLVADGMIKRRTSNIGRRRARVWIHFRYDLRPREVTT